MAIDANPRAAAANGTATENETLRAPTICHHYVAEASETA